MKVLIAYVVKINGIDRFGNAILPEGTVPIRWIAEMNLSNKNQRHETFVDRQYILLNSWQMSDYELRDIEIDGTGVLSLANGDKKP